jgi:glycosyltransferase involved in cell wall biosynthesis
MKSEVKIIQSIATIYGEGDGPGRIVGRICTLLADKGHESRLHVLEPFSPSDYGGTKVNVHRRWTFLRSLGISPAFRLALMEDCRDADVVHTHGMWMMPNIYPSTARRVSRVKLVHSPRGTLAANALAFHPLRKKLMWKVLQARAVERADLLHATAEKEVAEFRDIGLKHPIALIPNGVDLPRLLPRVSGGTEKAVYVGRLHPLKGLEALVRAWAQCQTIFPRWELWLVGPSEIGHGEYLQALCKRLGAERVVFPGPLYGEEKHRLLCEAGLGIFPSHTENFGNAIGETMVRGTPVLVSHQTPWGQEVEAHGCGWAITDLARDLSQALSRPLSQRRHAGLLARERIAEQYSWATLLPRFEAMYRWLSEGGTRPTFIEGGQSAKVITFAPRKAG